MNNLMYKRAFFLCIAVYGLTLLAIFRYYKPSLIVVTPADEQGNARLLVAQYPHDLRVFTNKEDLHDLPVGISVEEILKGQLGYGRGLINFHFPSGISGFSGKLSIISGTKIKTYKIEQGVVSN